MNSQEFLQDSRGGIMNDFSEIPFLFLSVIQQCSFVLSQNGTVRSMFINFVDSTKPKSIENKA